MSAISGHNFGCSWVLSPSDHVDLACPTRELGYLYDRIDTELTFGYRVNSSGKRCHVWFDMSEEQSGWIELRVYYPIGATDGETVKVMYETCQGNMCEIEWKHGDPGLVEQVFIPIIVDLSSYFAFQLEISEFHDSLHQLRLGPLSFSIPSSVRRASVQFFSDMLALLGDHDIRCPRDNGLPLSDCYRKLLGASMEITTREKYPVRKIR